jgi:DNA-binding NarL/FixJ family response regulator
MTIRLVLADDHSIFLDGLEGLLRLEPEFEVVGRYTSGKDALLAVRDLAPDILVLDLRMPDMDGLEVLRRLVHEGLSRASTRMTCWRRSRSECGGWC